MPSRYTSKQKKKNPYIKWSLIIVPILLIIAAGSWYFLQTQNNAGNGNTATENKVQEKQTSIEEPKEEETETAEETDKAEEAEKAKQQEKAEQEEKAKQQEMAEQEEKAKQAEKAKQEKESETAKEELAEKPAAETKPKEPQKSQDATAYSETVKLPSEPTVVKGILLANKQHPLPKTYAPGESKEARAAFETMRKKALEEDIDLVAFSTYRDFSRQTQLYDSYVAKDGQTAADRYSARPGYSEHQTGLAFDIGEAGLEKHWASASFGDTEAGKWLAKNAHNYGFILRYPKGSESITGYMHESWHFRYVGKKVATEIYKQGVTLEQYLGV